MAGGIKEIQVKKKRGDWRIEINRQKRKHGFVYHWNYRKGSKEKRITQYGGNIQKLKETHPERWREYATNRQ